MGKFIRLHAADGHAFDAYQVIPAGKPQAGLVVIQEIFGVNDNIRRLCDGFASEGYLALAPALFDRAKPKVDLGYTAEGIEAGRALRAEIGWDAAMLDIAAAFGALKDAGKTGIVGYCWGGSLAWLAACRLKPACAISYYGGQITQFVDETPLCPTMLHFGALDAMITPKDIDAIRHRHPHIPVHVYETAGHGFDCDARKDFHPASSTRARARSRAFFNQHLA